MSDYTQGVCQDGAAILRDGEMLTIEEILEGLRQADELAEALEKAVAISLHAEIDTRFPLVFKSMEEVLTNYRKSKGE